jgi:hypothetical protein
VASVALLIEPALFSAVANSVPSAANDAFCAANAVLKALVLAPPPVVPVLLVLVPVGVLELPAAVAAGVLELVLAGVLATALGLELWLLLEPQAPSAKAANAAAAKLERLIFLLLAACEPRVKLAR